MSQALRMAVQHRVGGDCRCVGHGITWQTQPSLSDSFGVSHHWDLCSMTLLRALTSVDMITGVVQMMVCNQMVLTRVLGGPLWGPHNFALVSAVFAILTIDSANPFEIGQCGLLVMCSKLNVLSNSVKAAEAYCSLLLVHRVSGIPCQTNSSVSLVMTALVLVPDAVSLCTNCNLEYVSGTSRNIDPSNKESSEPRA